VTKRQGRSETSRIERWKASALSTVIFPCFLANERSINPDHGVVDTIY